MDREPDISVQSGRLGTRDSVLWTGGCMLFPGWVLDYLPSASEASGRARPCANSGQSLYWVSDLGLGTCAPPLAATGKKEEGARLGSGGAGLKDG